MGAAAGTLDIASIIDTGRWSARQKWAAILGGLAMLVDGFDNQLLGIAVPAIAADWGVEASAFAPALSIGLVGMLVGNAMGGAFGDRFGRKPALLASMALFGIVTLAIAWVDSLTAFFWCRFIGGIGLGATVPNASALVAETTPNRHRTLVVTISTLGSPAGGVVAGLIASCFLSADSWKLMFIGGGLAPLAHITLSSFLLTESPFYLAARKDAGISLRNTLASMKLDAPDGGADCEPGVPTPSTPLRMILEPAWRRDTLLLWGVSACNMMALYMLLSWLPSMLAGAGYSIAVASLGLSMFSLGSMVGAVCAGWITQRLGSRRTMFVMASGAAAVAVLLGVPALGPGFAPGLLIGSLALLGLLGGGFNVMVFPLSLNAYPAPVRAGAFGLVLAIGRGGAAASPFVAVAATSVAASHGLFAVYAALMLVSAGLLLFIVRHILPADAGLSRE